MAASPEEALSGLRDLVLGGFVRESTREWAPATFYWALFRAFANLHELALERGDDFWNEPAAEVRFPFGWDASSPDVPRLVVDGREPHEVLSAARLSVETMTEEDREFHFQAMLAGALHGAAPPGYRRDVGDSYAVHIPKSLKDDLDKLPLEEREAEGWRRIAPFRMGERTFRPPESYPKPSTMRELVPPPVHVQADTLVDGKPIYKLATFAELGQVTTDPGETSAYYPLVVGLALEPGSTPPSDWPENEREKFWPWLLEALEVSVRENITNASNVPVLDSLARTDASRELQSAASDTVEAVVVSKGPSLPVRVLRDAPTRYDREALRLVHGLASLKLPRKLASVPSWEKLEAEEIQRLQEEDGDLAFNKLPDPNGRAPLLRRTVSAKEGNKIVLTPDGRSSLLERWSNRWFRQTQKDEDGVTREYVVRHLPVRGGGHLEARFTLYGQAWPLVEDARDDFESQARARLAPPQTSQASLLLYDAAEEKLRAELESRLQFIRAVKDAHVLMRAILAEFGATGRNPVEKPLHELRHLLGYEKDPDGPRKVRGALRSLSELRFRLEASGVDGFNGKTFGSFVAEVEERRRGKGEHVDGEVLIHLAPSAIGGLRVFSLGAYQVKEPKKLLFDWNKTLSKEDKETSSSEPYLRSFSKLAPYYDRHLGLTVSQTKLREWLEHNVTRNKDGVTKERASLRRKPGAADANAPRLYDCSFCPALPEGETFVAALGHYEARKGGGAERGRKLAGSATPPAVSGKSGGREGGLLHVMGYELPKNRSASRRQEVTLRVLQDMKCVVEDHFKGAVVARRGSEWLRLEDATDKLSVEELLSGVSWFFFLPPDWLAHMHATYNALQEERFKRGETDTIYKMVPADAPEAPRERPLRERLRKAMADRKLTGPKVAELFGVTKMSVSRWLNPDTGKPIAEALVPLVERWIETGEPPLKEELAAIKKPGRKVTDEASSSAR